jgi:hypothetical protein
LLNQPDILQALRASKAQSNISILMNFIWNKDILGNLKQALEDLADDDINAAQQALFEKMWELNKQAQQKKVEQFYRDELPGKIDANLAKLRQARRLLVRARTDSRKERIISAVVNIVIPAEIIQAMTDTKDGDKTQAKQALFEKMTQILERKAINLTSRVDDKIKQFTSIYHAKISNIKRFQVNNPTSPFARGAAHKLVSKFWQRILTQEERNALLDINDYNEAQAKQALYEKMWIINQSLQQRKVDRFTRDELPQIVSDNLNDRGSQPGLRTIHSQGSPQTLVNQFVQRVVPVGIIQAMTDVKDGNADAAKQALFQKMWEINKAQQQKQVEQFYKDELPAIVEANLAELRDVHRQGASPKMVTKFINKVFACNRATGMQYCEFMQALFDVHNRYRRVAKQALFTKMWELNKQAQQKKLVEQFYKDKLPGIVQANLAKLRQARRLLVRARTDSRKERIISAVVNIVIPAEIIQAMVDIKDGNEAQAKQALFTKMLELNKASQTRTRDRFFVPSQAARDLAKRFKTILDSNAWPVNIKDALWRKLSRKERKAYRKSAEEEIYKEGGKKSILTKFLRRAEITNTAKEQLFDGYLLTYLLNQPDILQALRASKAQSNISILMNFIWNISQTMTSTPLSKPCLRRCGSSTKPSSRNW